MTALHHAALSGFEDTVKALVSAGADVNADSPDYGTPLSLAALKGRQNVVATLLASRANVGGPGGVFGSPMHAACYSNEPEVIHTLLKHGANPDLARFNRVHWYGYSWDGDIKSLIELSPKASSASTPLYVATSMRSTDAVRSLLDNGASVAEPEYEALMGLGLALESDELAEEVFRRALEHAERIYGKDQFDTIYCRRQLAGTLKRQKKYQMAAELCQNELDTGRLRVEVLDAVIELGGLDYAH